MSRESLEDLIDRMMASGEWYGINIFAGCGDGARVHLLRTVSTAVCDQCTDPAARPSERLRMMLEANDRPAKRAPIVDSEIEDLLG